MRPPASTIVPDPIRSVPRMRDEACASGIFACTWTVEGRTRSMRPTAAFTCPTLDARRTGRKHTIVQKWRRLTHPGRVPTIRAAMRVVPLALRRDPTEVLASLADEPGAFLLDVPDPVEPVTLVGCAPAAELRVHAATDGDALAAIERFVADTPADAPFPCGGVIG